MSYSSRPGDSGVINKLPIYSIAPAGLSRIAPAPKNFGFRLDMVYGLMRACSVGQSTKWA